MAAVVHLGGVAVSMRVVSAGDGYRYLLKSVAGGDGGRDWSTPLTRYYAVSGTPPGRWLGSGLADLGDHGARLAVGGVVSEEQLRRLLGAGRDPVTGSALGRPYPAYKTVEERVADRVARLDPDLPADERAASTAAIEADETKKPRRRAVAGFDYTFSLPKSASVLWAVADAATQRVIADVHHAAVAQVVALMEREVAATRIGAVGADGGAVAQVPVTGLVAAAFDHYDSRAGDPHLHTHVVISNKARTMQDGKWRALDGRPLHAATVALSEHYHALFADQLTRALGVGWAPRARGADRNPAFDITGIPDELLNVFSQRAHAIDASKDELIAAYITQHGRQPSPRTVLKLRQQATLATRPDKHVQPLSELTTNWRQRATTVLGKDATTWAAELLATTDDRAQLGLHADAIPGDALSQIAQQVVDAVGTKRATWRHWNLWAEASRQTMGLRFASPEDREMLIGQVVAAAEDLSIRLTPAEAASTPPELRRADGTSMFRPAHADVFTSEQLLAAENRLLKLSRTRSAPAIDPDTVDHILTTAGAGRRRRRDNDRRGRAISVEQRTAIARIAGSGRATDVMVGPAGAGKTTTMRALHAVWERQCGRGSVVGLAPSAAAAQALSDDLGVATENTVKWLHEHHHGRWNLQPCQLMIIDEASLAATADLDTLTTHAADVGAKVLLVGDPHQLDAIDAGAFTLLVGRRRTAGDLPELADVQRFTAQWEKTASLRLRNGDTDVLDTYAAHDRITAGDTDDMLDAAYQAWKRDVAAGRRSLMIAEARDTVTELNTRARTDRVAAGEVDSTREVALHDDTHASVGDLVVTRRNDRRLAAGRGWVKNGDHWHITKTHRDGSLTVRRANSTQNHDAHRRRGAGRGAAVRLPAAYVAAHVELGYATTVHRAQGATVDTAHVVVTPQMSREAYYVAMTRARNLNKAYVATDRPDLEDHQHNPGERPTARGVLTGVLHRAGAETSAHQTADAERERWGSIAQLAAEYETLVDYAQQHRWKQALQNTGLSSHQVDAVVASDAYGPLTGLLRRADATGHRVESFLPTIVAAGSLDDTDDPAAVLHHRIHTAITSATGREASRPSRLVAGLIPEPGQPTPDHLRDALEQRKRLIEARADNLTDQAIHENAHWLRAVGAPPADPQRRAAWLRHVRVVAAYRDRHHITTDQPLGPAPATENQRADHTRAYHALQQARQHIRAEVEQRFGSPSRTPTRPPGPTM